MVLSSKRLPSRENFAFIFPSLPLNLARIFDYYSSWFLAADIPFLSCRKYAPRLDPYLTHTLWKHAFLPFILSKIYRSHDYMTQRL